jgi:hypothetical protein
VERSPNGTRRGSGAIHPSSSAHCFFEKILQKYKKDPTVTTASHVYYGSIHGEYHAYSSIVPDDRRRGDR